MVKTKELSQVLKDVVAKHCEMQKPTDKIMECVTGQVSERTVYRWVSKFKKNGLNLFFSSRLFTIFSGKKSPDKSPGRPPKSTQKLKKKVKILISSYTGRSVSRMLGVSHNTVQRAVKEMNLKVF